MIGSETDIETSKQIRRIIDKQKNAEITTYHHDSSFPSIRFSHQFVRQVCGNLNIFLFLYHLKYLNAFFALYITPDVTTL